MTVDLKSREHKKMWNELHKEYKKVMKEIRKAEKENGGKKVWKN